LGKKEVDEHKRGGRKKTVGGRREEVQE